MFILTDSMRSLISELATAGRMDLAMDADGIHITVDCSSAPGKRDPDCAKRAPKPEKPYFGKKRGRKATPQYKVIDGRRRRLYAFNGESRTVAEWAEKYGVGEKTMASRFRASGTPETTHNRSKSDKSTLKSKVAS